jgi:hypothetical protein
MLKYFLVALGLAAGLTGCGLTPQGDAFRQGIATYGAKAYDEGLDNAEWYMCSAASIGSIKRKYGTSQKMAEAYRALCGAGEDADVIGPVPTAQP